MKITILFSIVLFSSQVFAEYKIPVADSQESSPPIITGKVISISGSSLTVLSNDKEIKVLINRNTQIFTVYGGYVFLSQICSSENIEIWYNNPTDNILNTAAAAIRVPRKCN